MLSDESVVMRQDDQIRTYEDLRKTNVEKAF